MNPQQQLGEWWPLLSHCFQEPWMHKLGRRLGAAKNIAPPLNLVFRAFELCPPSKVKVVIMLQDPYINGEADGIAMSSYAKMTPSLEVVFAEINRTEMLPRTVTHLDDWAMQGVLLINAALTTQLGKSRAHQGWGWEYFTAEVLRIVWQLPQPIVYLMWGKDAQDVLKNTGRKSKASHMRLSMETCHPQAQNYNPSNKFVGCYHFRDTNLFLIKQGVVPIWWSDPGYLARTGVWETFIDNLQKQIGDATIDTTRFLHSYPSVQGGPHPYDTGLEFRDRETLPF